MRADMAPEDQLCLLLATGQVPALAQEKACALLATPLHWNLILERAAEHGVSPLLYRNLRRLGFPGVPAEVRTELESFFRMNALWNTLLANELARVLRLLNEAAVPAIPLKGIPLAESLYGDSSLRVCADIDILVPRQGVAQAFQLILAAGYRAEFTEPFFADVLFRSEKEYSLVRREGQGSYLLELHWELMWGAPMDREATEDLWAEAQPKPVFGVPAYRLSPEWEFLYLAAHAARHRWQTLKWLVDVHELCSHDEID